jgi:hypothetical protein
VYAGIVWAPIYNNHTWALEKIQRHFAKFLVFNETGNLGDFNRKLS